MNGEEREGGGQEEGHQGKCHGGHRCRHGESSAGSEEGAVATYSEYPYSHVGAELRTDRKIGQRRNAISNIDTVYIRNVFILTIRLSS